MNVYVFLAKECLDICSCKLIQMGHRDGPWPRNSKTNGIRKVLLRVMGREYGPWPVNSASRENL